MIITTFFDTRVWDLTSSLSLSSSSTSLYCGPCMIGASLAPISAINGVNAIEETMTTTRILLTSSGKNPSLFARAKRTNPNSPPCPRINPSFADSGALRLNGLASSPRMVDFTAIRLAMRAAVSSGCSRKTEISMLMPVVMKNRPSNRPRKGSISTWILDR